MESARLLSVVPSCRPRMEVEGTSPCTYAADSVSGEFSERQGQRSIAARRSVAVERGYEHPSTIGTAEAGDSLAPCLQEEHPPWA